MDEDGISLEEMAARTGVEPRTLRSWIAEGLLSPPYRPGRGARYPQANVARALAVRALKEGRGLQLSEIRRRFLSLDDDGLRSLDEDPAPDFAAPAPASPILDYLRDARAGTPPAPSATPAPQAGLAALRAALERAARAPTGRGRAEDWTRIAISPDLELHARGALSPQDRATLDRIAALIRSILTGGLTHGD
jgi:DNA-binding transcriptional MerR regulator